MRGAFRACLGWVAASSPLAIGTPANAEPLQPRAQWHVDFADSQCVASRDYGPVGSPLFLVFKKPPIGDVLQIVIVRNGSLKIADQTAGQITFDQRAPIKTNFLEYGITKLGQRALMMNLPMIELAPMRQASTIQIRTRPENLKYGETVPKAQSDYTFRSTDIPQVLDLLNECAADLREVWNVWDENHPSVMLKQGPSGDLQGLFSPKDYPSAAQRREQMGTASMVILIDEAGRVADCTITQTSGAASIDAQSCAVFRERAKFRPAIGLDGKPAKSTYLQSITWRLEG